MENTALLWFRNDLRLHDHEALSQALRHARHIVPVYVIDPALFSTDRWGIGRCGPYRLCFLQESLADLDRQLRGVGSRLLLVSGKPGEIIPRLAEQYRAGTVYAHREATTEETDAERQIAREVELRLCWGSTLHHPDDLPFPDGKPPRVFTVYRKAVEQACPVRPLLPAPQQIPAPRLQEGADASVWPLTCADVRTDPRAAMAFRGGSVAGRERLRHYFWESRALSRYKETRNGLMGPDYSSRLSPWLAVGSLSARQVYWELRQYEEAFGANESTYWLVNELMWRDFFRLTALHSGHDFFRLNGISGTGRSWKRDPEAFRMWCEGRTGDRFVDANMRELALTGWMSNRGRQNAASYLVHNLETDWRMGAAWFERLLIDYDPCSNYGNWMYIAGVGNDPRGGRSFDTLSQAETYDPTGAYRSMWLEGEPHTH
jgi:deoxyribodipyrimidine photo-lyase